MSEPWSDDRLSRAYRVAYSAPAPTDLVRSVVDGLPARARPSNRRLPALAALAALVALTVGVGLVMSPGPYISPPRRTPLPASPAPRVDGFPAEVFGLPVISVSAAIARRDAGPDDTELAVRGWEPPVPPHSCPHALVTPTPVERRCGDDDWLTEEREVLWEESDIVGPQGSVIARRVGSRSPTGPALQPLYRLEVPRQQSVSDGEPTLSFRDPRRVVLLGHFADYRSDLCGGPGSCRHEFVVDARVWVDGVDAGREVVDVADESRPRLGIDQVTTIAEAAAGTQLGGPWIAAVGRPYLADVDPRIEDTPGLDRTAIVWVVRFLVREKIRVVARTFFVADETGATFVGRSDAIVAVADDSPEAPPVEFPGEVVGLPVISVQEAIAAHYLEGEPPISPAFEPPYDQELAVRGYFVAPPAGVGCLEGYCPDDGRLWLLAQPEQPWRNLNLVGDWRPPVGPVLNLVVGRDATFGLPTSHDETGPHEAVPVVVVGHFASQRERDSTSGRWLFVDALVWASGEPLPGDTLELDRSPREDRSAVEARVAAHAGPAIATWATVMSGAAFAEVHKNPSTFDQELGRAEIVWQFRRLVRDENDFPVVRRAWSADGSDRVWLELWFDYVVLQPTHRVDLGGAGSVQVTDYSDVIVTVTAAGGAEPSDVVVAVGSDTHPGLRLSNPGGDPLKLRIGWVGGRCEGPWKLQVVAEGPSPILDLPYAEGACRLVRQEYSVVLTLSKPISADKVFVNTSMAPGG